MSDQQKKNWFLPEECRWQEPPDWLEECSIDNNESWVDNEQDDCTFYELSPSNCIDAHDYANVDGMSAVDACCVCQYIHDEYPYGYYDEYSDGYYDTYSYDENGYDRDCNDPELWDKPANLTYGQLDRLELYAPAEVLDRCRGIVGLRCVGGIRKVILNCTGD